MRIFEHILLSLGGITLFLLGLKFISENMENLSSNKVKNLIRNFTKNKYVGVLTGAGVTALVQSSIATNVIVVGFVSSGIITFYSGSAVIMGSNIGTTITAHLVSLSQSSLFNITALGSLIGFIGFLISFSKNKNASLFGNVLTGFCMIFLGLDVISNGVEFFKNYEFFRAIFLVKNDVLLFLNGLVITAIVQSSSAVSSVIIILASNGLVDFSSAIFLILGANVGTCLPVIVASLNKSEDALKTAFFNLLFNVVGVLILFFPLTLFKGQITLCFNLFSNGIEKQIANFHTLFNLFVTVVFLPFLKYFTAFIDFLFLKFKQTSKNSLKGV